jgi:hypothetical protein
MTTAKKSGVKPPHSKKGRLLCGQTSIPASREFPPEKAGQDLIAGGG